MYSQLEDLIN